MVCALMEDENGYFCENELRMFRMVEKQSGRLRDEAARTLREYVLQVRELFQAEIDHHFSAIVPGGGVERYELCGYAETEMAVRLSGCNEIHKT